MKHKNKLAVLVFALSVSACVTPPRNTAQTDQVRQQNVQLLNEFSEFKKELRFLRGAVEEMQFETDNMQRRQEDLFEDFNRRLLNLEARAGLTSGQAPGAFTTPQTEADVSNETVDNSGFIEGPETGIQNDNTQAEFGSQQQADTVNVEESASQDSLSVLEQKVYDNAIEKLQQSRYAEAIEGFSRLVEDWPQSKLADDSYYYMGEAQYVNRQYEQALRSFRQVVNNYPQSPRLPDATLKVGMIQYDVGAYNDAKDTFRSLLEQFPEHPSAETARTRLLRIEQTIE